MQDEVLYASDIVDGGKELHVRVFCKDTDGDPTVKWIGFVPTTLSGTELWSQAARAVVDSGVCYPDPNPIIEIWEPTQGRLVKTYRTVDEATGHVDDYWHPFYPEYGED